MQTRAVDAVARHRGGQSNPAARDELKAVLMEHPSRRRRRAGAPSNTLASGAELWVVFFVCCLYSMDVIKPAKGAYLEILF